MGAHDNKDHSEGRSLDIAAHILEFMGGRSSLHWGYWDDPDAVSKVTLQDYAEAGDQFTKRLVEAIPAGVETVLDIGCGTGELSARLVEKGYAVRALNPSRAQCEIARRKLPPGTRVHACTFEDFQWDGDAPVDCAIFSESFQYVDIPAAMEKLSKIAKYVVIMDYHKNAPDALQGGGYDREVFDGSYKESGFRIDDYTDVTRNMKPNYIFKNAYYNDLMIPIAETILIRMRQDMPLVNFFFGGLVRRKFLKIDRFRMKAERSADPENVVRWITYTLIVLANEKLA